tara:strand:- start:436 stop:603 length:168 start_codon:yes stop_codon:yes gene_type:complete
MTNTTRTDLINYLRNNNIKYDFLPYGQRIIIEVKVTEETEQEIKESLKLKQLINK